jgi:Protein of unknown function (DUF3631)
MTSYQDYAERGGESDPDSGERRERAEDYIQRSKQVAGTLAETYLRARGISGPAIAGLLQSAGIASQAMLRYLPHARAGEGALVAILAGLDGNTAGVHLTYIDATGRKSLVDPKHNRYMLEQTPGAVFLVRKTPPGKPTIITEGLEDALSVAMVIGDAGAIGLPGIACLHNLKLKGDIIIFPDGDVPAIAEKTRPMLTQGIDALILNGAKVRLADVQPGTDDAGELYKRDANSILQKDGPDALRALIEAAITAAPAELSPAGEAKRLSKMRPEARDVARKKVLEKFKAEGLRASTLDKLIDGEEKKSETKTDTLGIHDAKPWHEQVHIADILDDLSALLRAHVVMPATSADLAALWITHTWIYERFDFTGRLAINSPVMRCGKSTLASLLTELCRRTLSADSISASSVFRTIEAATPITLILDEVDAFLRENEELRGILNSGFAVNKVAIRSVEVRGEHVPTAFRIFAPVAMAGIKHLPGTLADRTFPLPLQRKKGDERVEKLRAKGAKDKRKALARKLARWAKDCGKDLNLDPAIPDDLGDRQGDISGPLLSIAEQAGGNWPARAHTALLAAFKYADLIGATPDRLLGDIRAVFVSSGKDRLPTKELLSGLYNIEDGPWLGWGRMQKPITAAQLAHELFPYRITPGTIRIGETVTKGYKIDQFAESWDRYLAPQAEEEAPAETETSPQPEDAAQSGSQPNGKDDNDQKEAPVTAGVTACSRDVTAKNPTKPSSSATCNRVTAESPHAMGEGVSESPDSGQSNGHDSPSGGQASSTTSSAAAEKLRATLIRAARRPPIKIVDLDAAEPEGTA